MAVKTDGTLWTWGHNSSGIIGDGTYSTFDMLGKVLDNQSKAFPTKIMDGVMLSTSVFMPPATQAPSPWAVDAAD